MITADPKRAELEQLLRDEGTRLQVQSLRQALRVGYTQLGGDVQNIKRVIELLVQIRAERFIDALDLPGPDSYLKPLVKGYLPAMARQTAYDIVEGQLLPEE